MWVDPIHMHAVILVIAVVCLVGGIRLLDR
jgi:hypothetical protein